MYLKYPIFLMKSDITFSKGKARFSVQGFQTDSKALSTLAGMPVRHYQLFIFYLASEALLPDNHIVLAPHATPFPTLCIGMGYENSLPVGH